MKFKLQKFLCFSLLCFGFFFISSCNNNGGILDSASITDHYLPSDETSSSENEFEDLSSEEFDYEQEYMYEHENVMYRLHKGKAFALYVIDNYVSSINIPTNIEYHNYDYAVEVLEQSIFNECTEIETLTLPFIGETIDSNQYL